MGIGEFKQRTLGLLYQKGLKKLLFMMDPEFVHDRFIAAGKLLGRTFCGRKAVSLFFDYQNSKLTQDIAGVRFKNPVGLAAGFDKNANLVDILPAVGFGFMEIGSVTGMPCSGNPKPRLWRLKESRSLAVNYGLYNLGSEQIAKKLDGRRFAIPLGISVAKTNSPATDEVGAGVADYAKAFKDLAGKGDYVTVNISCPNTSGGRPFLQAENLEKLLQELEKIPCTKPVFLKLSPDLNEGEIDAILETASKYRISGFICSNLTKKPGNPAVLDDTSLVKGGLSGKPVERLANRHVSYIWNKTKGRYVIIGCGGIFSAEDAYRMIRHGASLVQLITGMIFQGPQLIGEINRGLARLLEKDGLKNISEAVGIDAAAHGKTA